MRGSKPRRLPRCQTGMPRPSSTGSKPPSKGAVERDHGRLRIASDRRPQASETATLFGARAPQRRQHLEHADHGAFSEFSGFSGSCQACAQAAMMSAKISQVGLRCSQLSVKTPAVQTTSEVNHSARAQGASIQAKSASVAAARRTAGPREAPVSTSTERNVLCAVKGCAGNGRPSQPGDHGFGKCGHAYARPASCA